MKFSDELRKILAQIPEGRVTTYGDVADALGDVKSARAVSDFLERNRRESYRVVTAEGNARPWQSDLLRKEGISVSGGKVDNLATLRFSAFDADHPLGRLQEEQKGIAESVILEDGFETVEKVCGFDLAYNDDRATGAFAVVDLERLEVVESGIVTVQVDFPYIPGFLAYREFPVIKEAYEKMESDVSVLLVDGHGYAHPRRAGVACHVGVRLDRPTVGVAKSVLVGKAKVPSNSGCTELVQDDETVGYALRSSTSTKPIFVSPGHKISFDSSLQIVRGLCKTRIPEPLRHAHSLATSSRLG